MNKRYQLACICLGDCNVGKTTILNRAENNLNFNKFIKLIFVINFKQLN